MLSKLSNPIAFTALFLLSSAFLISEASESDHCGFSAIFNFGDSNSDTGGLAAAFGWPGLPAGETYFGRSMGRYCDGRLVIDFIAQSLGLPFLSAYLNSVGTNFTTGANFATAGSTIRPQNTTLRQSGFSPISLDVQFVEFSNFRNRSQLYLGKGSVYNEILPQADVFQNALYTFDIGQNDLTAGYFAGMTTDQVLAFIPDALSQFENVVKYIYGLGGRYFWIHNTGPVGCLSYVLDRLPVKPGDLDKAGCAIPYNQVAQHFNRLLKQTVQQLRQDLPRAALTYVDVYTAKYNLFSHTRKYGFTRSVRACCGHGGKYKYNKNIGCGQTREIGGKMVVIGTPCKDPTKAIIWDGVHYTDAGNKLIFEQIVDGGLSDPPLPLNMACARKS